MLSKLLTTTALSSVLSQGASPFGGDERFGELYTKYACKLAEMTPDDAQDYHRDWVDDLIMQDNYNNVRDRLVSSDVDKNVLSSSAQRECERMGGLRECGEDEDPNAPGAFCRQLNQAAIAPIIGGYGCWGNFPTDVQINAQGNAAFSTLVANGRGPPKDELDRAARDLVQSYKCIMEETILQGSSCNPWEEMYMPIVPPASSSGGFAAWTAQCEGMSVNGATSCNVKACLVETYFVARYIAWTYTVMNANNGYQVPNDDTTYFHATAEWNEQKTYSGTAGQFVNNAANCPTTGVGPIHIYCCGAYPFRKRNHSAVDTDQCCNGDIYNDTTHQCCGDPDYMGDVGTVELLAGACPTV